MIHKLTFCTTFIGLLFSCTVLAQKAPTLQPIQWRILETPEPSDICLHPNGNSYYLVSDDGYLFELDLDGNIIRKADYQGIDSEGIHADENFVYVVEEFTRNILLFTHDTFELVRTVNIPYSGGRNKSYEAFTFNKAKGVFVLLTEKDPIYLFELDASLNKINEIQFNHIARDISAATYFDDHLWLLSDEDRTVFKLNPITYKVVNQWLLPVVNPEGIAFKADGSMVIVSDDMERMYVFNQPE